MNRWLAGALAAVAALWAPSQAGATIYWEQTYAPDPSGVTNLNFDDWAPIDPAEREVALSLQVIGGEFQYVDWLISGYYHFYTTCCGWDYAASAGSASGDTCGVEYGACASVLGPTRAAIWYWPYAWSPGPDIFDLTFSGEIEVSDASVIGNQPFTLTLMSTPEAPEAPTWAMMLLGFAGLGYAGYRRAKASRATRAA
jgi:hypothetical protein